MALLSRSALTGLPILTVTAGIPGAAITPAADGTERSAAAAEALTILRTTPHVLCGRMMTLRHLRGGKAGRRPESASENPPKNPPENPDVLELFAFVRPAVFCLPTPPDLARALGMSGGGSDGVMVRRAVEMLLNDLSNLPTSQQAALMPLARMMRDADWGWGAAVIEALEGSASPDQAGQIHDGVAAWRALPEWEWGDRGERREGQGTGVSGEAAAARLKEILGATAEERPGQTAYARAVSCVFAPREEESEPHVILAEAGTGTGKTLGYLAPASLWAQNNGGPVWLSTYTRNLQRQLDGELARVFPSLAERDRKVVIRKGRENYLCLYNYEELANRVHGTMDPAGHRERITAGLVARWIGACRDGDMGGGDFPAWLGWESPKTVAALRDRPGECLHGGCAHYKKCFIERAIRRSRRADLVVANHALVLTLAGRDSGGQGGNQMGQYYVFDEGHRLFEAADGIFAAHLTRREMGALAGWFGAAPGRGRSRGLRERLAGVAAGNEAVEKALAGVTGAALTALSVATGGRRGATATAGAGGEGGGEGEVFLNHLREQILAGSDPRDQAGPYDLETLPYPANRGLTESAGRFCAALTVLCRALAGLDQALTRALDDQTSDGQTQDGPSPDSPDKSTIEAARRGLSWRAHRIAVWRDMAAWMAAGEESPPEGFVDILLLNRRDGRETDVGMHRHHLDPSEPFARHVLEEAQGVVITSASLRDRTAASDDGEVVDWQTAEIRTGVRHLPVAAVRRRFEAPFDYADCARLIIVQDVQTNNPAALAGAFERLFIASAGGALGLFTSLRRLQAVHGSISPRLGARGLPVLAQHIDALDTATLTALFQAQPNACLLGSDALRDGADVPGDSLRLVVLERVPWPRPDIIHRARRACFGGRLYDDMLTRLRLQQAFGRLIRTANDRGVFVLLDGRTPGRLLDAFPPGAPVEKLPLAEAATQTAAFLKNTQA